MYELTKTEEKVAVHRCRAGYIQRCSRSSEGGAGSQRSRLHRQSGCTATGSAKGLRFSPGNLVEQTGIERTFKGKDVLHVDIVPLGAKNSQLLEIVKTTDFGDWVMVKAGNMKVTFDKESGVIVNTSGGGCPDIPYLHAELIDKKLSAAPDPKEIGFTLCALMLHRALEECLLIWKGGAQS